MIEAGFIALVIFVVWVVYLVLFGWKVALATALLLVFIDWLLMRALSGYGKWQGDE